SPGLPAEGVACAAGLVGGGAPGLVPGAGVGEAVAWAAGALGFVVGGGEAAALDGGAPGLVAGVGLAAGGAGVAVFAGAGAEAFDLAASPALGAGVVAAPVEPDAVATGLSVPGAGVFVGDSPTGGAA
ncbi:MAG TPA: hypothetical protein VGG33_09510, partial [Polyangia bacterium]